MDELTLSIIDRGSSSQAALQTALGQFATQSRAHVHVRFQPWTEARQNLGKAGLPNDGSIDIAEVDTAWMSDVIASGTLRPYSAHEVDQCRGNDDYLPALLECTHLVGETDTWAIPWLADTILLHYRKDLFVAARNQHPNGPVQSGRTPRNRQKPQCRRNSHPHRLALQSVPSPT